MAKAFDKFIKVKPSGAKKKEQIKQEKRSVKKEREDFFIQKKRTERAAKKEAEQNRALLQQARSKVEKPKFTKEVTVFDNEGKPKRKRLVADNSSSKGNSGRKSYYKPKETLIAEKQTEKEFVKKGTSDFDSKKAKPTNAKFDKPHTPKKIQQKVKVNLALPALNNKIAVKNQKEYTQIPLNKYVAHCGICSRREAAGLIKFGKVTVNNKTIIEPGYKVQEKDNIKFEGKTIVPQVELVYILLNKPKDFLTTADDPSGRKTVMDLVANATNERVYPVGRLDRNTTGVLLLTNDGDLAQKLTHPKNEIKKIYEAKLDRPLTKADFDKIMAGLQLEDGFIAPDSLAYADSNDKSVIGIEIHSGKNRIVRRIFEHLQYDVRNLDRVLFAGLTKKNVERGRFRFLLEKEIRNLKFLNASKGKK